MATSSVFSLSDLRTAGGLVVGPEWTEDRSRELLRVLRLTRATASDFSLVEEPITLREFSVAVRLIHEVLSVNSDSSRWPLFSGANSRPSIFKAAVTHAYELSDVCALVRLGDLEALLAWNVARWMLQLPQQSSPTLVFASPPARHRAAPRVRREAPLPTAV